MTGIGLDSRGWESEVRGLWEQVRLRGVMRL